MVKPTPLPVEKVPEPLKEEKTQEPPPPVFAPAPEMDVQTAKNISEQATSRVTAAQGTSDPKEGTDVKTAERIPFTECSDENTAKPMVDFKQPVLIEKGLLDSLTIRSYVLT